MSIKDELREKRSKVLQESRLEEQEMDSQAEKFIEEFIIPLFRTTFDARPNEAILYIEFHSNIGCWCYTTNVINWEKRKACPYKYEIVSRAVKLSTKYDIEAAKHDDGSGGDTFKFRLDIT